MKTPAMLEASCVLTGRGRGCVDDPRLLPAEVIRKSQSSISQYRAA
jgi:hypothetical protein